MAFSLTKLYDAMAQCDKARPHLLQHFVKVHSFARQIAISEGMKGAELETLEAAALMHDIAIPYCEAKYGSGAGPLQEKEGPALAREMLSKLDATEEMTERVCFLIAHHHTYTNIDALDYRILVEADFLVNLFEGNESPETIRKVYDTIFVTKEGRSLCAAMFGIE